MIDWTGNDKSLRVSRWLLALLGMLVLAGCSGEQGQRPDQAEEVLFERLWQMIDLGRPEFSEAVRAFENGNREEARALVLRHFREKPVPARAVPPRLPTNEHVLSLAHKARRGYFIFQEMEDSPLREDGSVDWNHRGPSNDQEWAWFLNRHYFFRYFLSAYGSREDIAYPEAIERFLLDWYWSNPVPERFSLTAAWRALEAARRIIDSWVAVYAALRDDPVLSDEALLVLLVGAGEHGSYLRRHHHFGGNHLITEMLALATVARVWPEFREAAGWLDYAVEKATGEINTQVYPDGMHKELSNHYQWIAATSFQRLYDLLKAEKREDKTGEFVARLEQMWDVFARVRRPTGEGPLNNDANIENNAIQILPIARSWGRDDWLYMGTFGREGSPPEGEPSVNYAWGGQAYFREDWSASSDWVYFDYGAYGSDHQHNDQLHISLSLSGIPILVDSGRYTYRDDAWAAFFRGWESHNIATFDRHVPILPDRIATQPADDHVFLGDGFRLASASIPLRVRGKWGWGGSFSRTVYHEGGLLALVDRFIPAVPDRIHWHWRLHPDLYFGEGNREVRKISSDELVARVASAGVDQLVSGGVVRGRLPPTIQGWYSPAYNERLDNAVLIRSARVAGPVVKVWVFAAPDLLVEDLVTADSEVEIRWQEAVGNIRSVTLILDPGRGGKYSAEVRGAAVRR